MAPGPLCTTVIAAADNSIGYDIQFCVQQKVASYVLNICLLFNWNLKHQQQQQQSETAYLRQGWIVVYLFIVRIGPFPVKGGMIIELPLS